jgi:diguanylate cyclase (GGDEF)-like protein
MTAGPRPAYRGGVVLVGFGLLAVALLAVYLTGEQPVRLGVLAVAGAVPVLSILAGLRLNRGTERLPWLLVLAGSAMLDVVNLIWFAQIGLAGADRVNLAVTLPLELAGYLGMLAATTLVVLRHAPHDSGGVIDAAVIGIATAAPLWEFLIRPRLLDSGASPIGQLVMLVQTLVLLGILGSLLRITRSTGRAQPALNLMFGALAATIMGLISTVLLVDPAAGDQPLFPGVCWILGYLFLGAGGLHPSVVAFMHPTGQRRDELSPVRLAYLGMFLALVPVVGGIPQLFGHPPDGLLLSLGPLVMVPLVLTRIGQLMTQRARDQRSLTYQANHDELTGLANRRRLFAQVESAMARYAAGTLPAVAVLYCDLDAFKPINDQLGHHAGDQVLRAVGERLTACLREGDAVGRIGGDEFLALCPGAWPADADAMRERIEKAMAAPVVWRGEAVHVGMTVGLAVAHSGEPMSADALVASADRDMYARKHLPTIVGTDCRSGFELRARAPACDCGVGISSARTG